MNITAAMVKELREKTSSGMMDCKKALTASEGDMEKAVAWLREKGLASATARSGKIASEGLALVHLTDDGKTAALVEVNSETDFVAKNEDFRAFVVQCAKQIAAASSADVEALLQDKWGLDGAETVQDALTQKVSAIGENIKIRRFEKLLKSENGALSAYVHGGGKIAVVVRLACEKESDLLNEAGKNVAMQIAAMSPRFISREDIGQDFIDSEREILTNQAKQDPKMEGKPDKVIEGVVEGRLQKEFKEMCLVDQQYIKGEGESVGDYLKTVAKELSADVKVAQYVRYEVGEGIEKKSENFADEVAKAMGN